MATKLSVKTGSEHLQVHPQLFFQKVVIAAKSSDDATDMFNFKICSRSPALFDEALTTKEA